MASAKLRSDSQYERQITELIAEFGELSLKSLRDEYRKLYSMEIPCSEHDGMFGDWLMSLENVNCCVKNKEKIYWIENNDKLHTPKRKTISPLQGRVQTPSKRSRSAPGNGNEDEEEDTDKKAPMARKERPSRSVRFQDDVQNGVKPQKNGRVSRVNNRANNRSKSEHRKENLGTPNIFGSLLIGDDFLIGIAMCNLKFRAVKDNGLLQAGLCVSGLTIAAATQRVLKQVDKTKCKHAIIYLGSMDIINGRELVQMMFDFNQLMIACSEMNIRPILCTLAPILNHQLNNRKETLMGFNQFLVQNKYGISAIDINKAFVQNGKSVEHCYMVVPRPISGNRSELVLWSPEGRSRFYNMILKNLGFAYNSNEAAVFDFM